MRLTLTIRHIAVVALFCCVIHTTTASLGDRLPEFQECVEVPSDSSHQCHTSLTDTGLQIYKLYTGERISA